MSHHSSSYRSRETFNAARERVRLTGKLAAALCLTLTAFAAPAAVTDLLSQSAWTFKGSGAVQGYALCPEFQKVKKLSLR